MDPTTFNGYLQTLREEYDSTAHVALWMFVEPIAIQVVRRAADSRHAASELTDDTIVKLVELDDWIDNPTPYVERCIKNSMKMRWRRWAIFRRLVPKISEFYSNPDASVAETALTLRLAMRKALRNAGDDERDALRSGLEILEQTPWALPLHYGVVQTAIRVLLSVQDLTEKEVHVVMGTLDGLTPKEIAIYLELEVNTVQKYLRIATGKIKRSLVG